MTERVQSVYAYSSLSARLPYCWRRPAVRRRTQRSVPHHSPRTHRSVPTSPRTGRPDAKDSSPSPSTVHLGTPICRRAYIGLNSTRTAVYTRVHTGRRGTPSILFCTPVLFVAAVLARRRLAPGTRLSMGGSRGHCQKPSRRSTVTTRQLAECRC